MEVVGEALAQLNQQLLDEIELALAESWRELWVLGLVAT
jgi:hypothetical protein